MGFTWRVAAGCMSLGAVILLGLACELVVSPDTLQNGNCGSGRKACPDPLSGAEECVGLGDPDFQCASTACSPCALRNSVDICDVSGICEIASCTQTTNAAGEVIEEWTNCNRINS